MTVTVCKLIMAVTHFLSCRELEYMWLILIKLDLFNSSSPSAAYMRRWTRSALVHVMACRLIGAKPLLEPVPIYYTPRTTKLLGGILVSLRPSVCQSVRPSVRPSVPPAVSALSQLQFRMDSFHISHKWSLPWEGVSHTMTFDLDLYLQGNSALT